MRQISHIAKVLQTSEHNKSNS